MAKSKPIVVAVTGDNHCGSTVALCPPKVKLDDGGEHIASKPQRWLWANWLDFWTRVSRVRHDCNGVLYTGFNGDLTDGDHHGTTQILSGNPTAQAAVVNAIMEPVLDLEPAKMFFVRGTEAHVGKSGCYEERVALGLKKDKRPVIMDPVTGNASHWKLELELQGIRLEFAHHGSVGQRPWTKPNVALNRAAMIFYEHARRGEKHPHLAIRSHHHQFVDTFSAHPVRLIQMPAWQLKTAFVHKVAADTEADIGGLIIVIEDGKYTVEPVLYKPEPDPVFRA